MGGRAVEGTGLENRQGGNSFVGSNPTPSASLGFNASFRFSFMTLDNSAQIRLIFHRLKPLVDEILRCFALKQIFLEKQEMEMLNDIPNALHSKICVNAWILFSDDKYDSYYRELVRLDDSLKQTITGSYKKEACEKIFQEKLLKLAGLEKKGFKKAKEQLDDYRNKYLCHREDLYQTDDTQKKDMKLVYPDTLLLARLAYGLWRIILGIKRIEESHMGANIKYVGKVDESFDDLISRFKSDCEESLFTLFSHSRT